MKGKPDTARMLKPNRMSLVSICRNAQLALAQPLWSSRNQPNPTSSTGCSHVRFQVVGRGFPFRGSESCRP
jgi:hypothetical protein